MPHRRGRRQRVMFASSVKRPSEFSGLAMHTSSMPALAFRHALGHTTVTPSLYFASPCPPRGETTMPWHFLVVDGADAKSVFPLPEQGVLVIGRSHQEVDIYLNDLFVGRVHCQVEVAPDGKVTAK